MKASLRDPAEARRKQRVTPSSTQHRVQFSEKGDGSSHNHQVGEARADIGYTSLNNNATDSWGTWSSSSTDPVTTTGRSKTSSSFSSADSALLERSFEVAEEAASVLASVRKQQRPPAPPTSSVFSSEAEYLHAPLQTETTAYSNNVPAGRSRLPPSSSSSLSTRAPEQARTASVRTPATANAAAAASARANFVAPVAAADPPIETTTYNSIPDERATLPLPSSSSLSTRAPEQARAASVRTPATANATAASTRASFVAPAAQATADPPIAIPSSQNNHTRGARDQETASRRSPSPQPASHSASSRRPPPAQPTNHTASRYLTNSRPPEPVTSTRTAHASNDDSQLQQQHEPDLVEEIVHEDLEPIVYRPLIDAASLPHQSLVMLRSYANSSNDNDNTSLHTLQVQRQKQQAANTEKVRMTRGFGLGLSSELWKLVLIESHLARAARTEGKGQVVLCYGDRVALQSSSENLFVGVRLTATSDTTAGSTPAHFQVGCFRPSVGHAEQWMVLRAKDGGVIRLGRAAIEHCETTKARGPTATVQAGDPIVLRNCQTGGILASSSPSHDDSRDDDDPSWKLLMDSYDANRIRHGVVSDPTLLGRLQRHDRLVPECHEIFYFVPAAVPPTPQWICTRQRIFLNGSYLFHANRHGGGGDKLTIEASAWLGGDRPYREVAELTGATLSAEDRSELREPSIQERFLVDELLGSFLGLEGQFIRVRNAQRTEEQDISFDLFDSTDEHLLDRILCSLVKDMLRLSTSYARVRRFVSTRLAAYEYGCVMHCLCEAMDILLQEYMSFIGSLESVYRESKGDSLSLWDLQVQIQPTLHILSVLEQAVATSRSLNGGALLNGLRTLKLRTYQGDGVACSVLHRLLETATAPYLSMLGEWLECGILTDPYSEFMIQCCESASWENRYEIASDHVLEGLFTTTLTVERVLATGRYWNVVHTCNRNRKSTEQTEQSVPIQYSESSAAIASFVHTNYQKASRTLTGLLLDDNDLMGCLRLVKRYFLLDQGDFFLYFLDVAEQELRKNLTSVSRGRIQHWLDVSIQLTESHIEERSIRPCWEQKNGTLRLAPAGIRCKFAPESLTEHLDKLHAASGGIDTHEPWTPLRHTYGGISGIELTGLDAFMVDFASIPFPVSLILSQPALACYQLLFRHLFCAKHVERCLVGIWKDHQGMKELQSLRGSMGPTFLLRQRMLHFMQNLIYYMMLEVIQPHWSEMEAAIVTYAETTELTIDDIMQVHMQFLQRAQEACLLTNRDLVRALTKLMKTCLLFSDQMNLFMKATKIEDDKDIIATEKHKVVQKSMNERRGSTRFSIDRKTLQKNIQSGRLERKQRIDRQTARVEREIMGESYHRMISRFEQVFSDNLREFMMQLTHSDDLYHSQKVNLCIRLDYNGYVTKAMGLRTDL